MPQHKSAVKRVRQSEKRRERNRTHRSKMRTLIKQVFETEDKEQAQEALKAATAYLDRMATKGIIHKNKAANKKSQLAKHVNNLG